MKGKTIKLLEKNIGEYLLDLKVGNVFLNTKTMKEETDKIDFIKIKTFNLSKGTFKKMRKQSTE